MLQKFYTGKRDSACELPVTCCLSWSVISLTLGKIFDACRPRFKDENMKANITKVILTTCTDFKETSALIWANRIRTLQSLVTLLVRLDFNSCFGFLVIEISIKFFHSNSPYHCEALSKQAIESLPSEVSSVLNWNSAEYPNMENFLDVYGFYPYYTSCPNFSLLTLDD